MEIKDENQLKELISQELEKALGNIAQNISSQLTENILQDVYGNPVSEYYDRTMQFLKSVIKPNVTIKGDSVSVTIGMDSSLIESSLGGKNKLNKHMSVNGLDFYVYIYENNTYVSNMAPEEALDYVLTQNL